MQEIEITGQASDGNNAPVSEDLAALALALAAQEPKQVFPTGNVFVDHLLVHAFYMAKITIAGAGELAPQAKQHLIGHKVDLEGNWHPRSDYVGLLYEVFRGDIREGYLYVRVA
ncbi:MAG: hypothetical protein ACI87A_002669 [Planctomycetota bacterium]